MLLDARLWDAKAGRSNLFSDDPRLVVETNYWGQETWLPAAQPGCQQAVVGTHLSGREVKDTNKPLLLGWEGLLMGPGADAALQTLPVTEAVHFFIL